MQPRDTVLFELGLFNGRLGTSKSAFLIDKGVKLLSDFNGLSLAYFDKTAVDSFTNTVNGIKELFLASANDEINFSPSATLASVYFANLIAPVCKFSIENGGFTVKKTLYKK